MNTKPDRSIKDQVTVFGPALLILLMGFILAYQFVDPAPPDRIRIATGEEGGAYYLFSQAYRDYLQREKVSLEILNTSGSIENIRLLESGKVDIAFVQGGVAEIAEAGNLLSLGSLYFEPIWLFHRKSMHIRQLTDLRHKRVGVGIEGSGTRALALRLLSDNLITESNADFRSMESRVSAQALVRGEIDAAFFVASPQSTVVHELLQADQIMLMDFKRADAYTRLHDYLSMVILPEGIIDLERNLPSRQTRLLATGANLVGHRNLHPALIDLLLQTATEVHGKGGWFEQAGQFPNPDYLDFPLIKEAKRFYKYGPPFLQRYLPFWAATLVDRLKVMMLPLVALLLPLFKIMPPLYRWRMRSRIYPWYKEVQAIDKEAYQTVPDIDHSLTELTRIEREVANITVPLSFTEELYDLRVHISLVQKRLEKQREREMRVKGA